MKKRIISIFLCIVVTVTCLYVPAGAAGSLPDVPAPYIIFDDWNTHPYRANNPTTYIRIMNDDFCTIRYTLDGTTPDSSSPKFPSELLGVQYPPNGTGIVKRCLKLLVSKNGYNPKIFTYYFGIHKEWADGIISTPQYVNLTEAEAKLTIDNIIAGYANKVMKKKSALERIVLASKIVGSSMVYDEVKIYSNFKNTSRNRTIQVCRSLVMGCGVCDDYSQVFSTLCTKTGIDCVMVYSSTMFHSWNMVRYNGKWYNVDVTGGFNMISDKEFLKRWDSSGYINDRKIGTSYLNSNPLGLSSAPTSTSSIDEGKIEEMTRTTIPEVIYVDKGAMIRLDYFMKDIDKAQFMSYDKSTAAVVMKSGKYYIKGFKNGDTKIAIKTDDGTEYVIVSVRNRKKSKKFDVSTTELKLNVGKSDWVYAIRDKIMYDDDEDEDEDEALTLEGYLDYLDKKPDLYFLVKADNGCEVFMNLSPSENIYLTDNSNNIHGVSPGKATVYVVGSSGRMKKVSVTVTK